MARGKVLTSLIGDKRSYPSDTYFSLPPKQAPIFDEKSKILCESLNSVHQAVKAGKYNVASSTLASLIIEEDDEPKISALTSIHTAIKEKNYDKTTTELLTLLNKEKAKPRPVEKPKVKPLAESIALVHKALNKGKYDLAIDILTSLIDTVNDPLSCPRKYRPDGFDDQTIRSVETSMRSIRTAIEDMKYGEATVELVTLYSFPMVQTPWTSSPRVFDKPFTVNEIVEKLDEAHDYAKQPYFSAAAYVIVTVLDSKVSEKDFIDAAVKHHLRDKRTYLEEPAYKANNLWLYESVLELRRDNYLIQQLRKQCKERGGF